MALAASPRGPPDAGSRAHAVATRAAEQAAGTRARRRELARRPRLAGITNPTSSRWWPSARSSAPPCAAAVGLPQHHLAAATLARRRARARRAEGDETGVHHRRGGAHGRGAVLAQRRTPTRGRAAGELLDELARRRAAHSRSSTACARRRAARAAGRDARDPRPQAGARRRPHPLGARAVRVDARVRASAAAGRVQPPARRHAGRDPARQPVPAGVVTCREVLARDDDWWSPAAATPCASRACSAGKRRWTPTVHRRLPLPPGAGSGHERHARRRRPARPPAQTARAPAPSGARAAAHAAPRDDGGRGRALQLLLAVDHGRNADLLGRTTRPSCASCAGHTAGAARSTPCTTPESPPRRGPRPSCARPCARLAPLPRRHPPHDRGGHGRPAHRRRRRIGRAA